MGRDADPFRLVDDIRSCHGCQLHIAPGIVPARCDPCRRPERILGRELHVAARRAVALEVTSVGATLVSGPLCRCQFDAVVDEGFERRQADYDDGGDQLRHGQDVDVGPSVDDL